MSELDKKIGEVFTYLSDISCGTLPNSGGDQAVLFAKAERKLTDEEIKTIENYIRNETGTQTVYLQIEQPKK